jgi:glycine cleavage system H protein
MSDEYPDELYYTKDHEWARIDGDIAQIGITRFAVEQLGDVTQVELPDEGETITKGEVFGTVESVKAVSDLYAPVTGTVVRTNTPLNESPQNVNEEPYDEGWMIEVKVSDRSQLEELMSAEDYRNFIAEES